MCYDFKEICANLPHPDLRHLESILRSLRRKILKALPTSRLGTGRDAVAFKRVKLHLQAFKVCKLYCISILNAITTVAIKSAVTLQFENLYLVRSGYLVGTLVEGCQSALS